MKYLILIYAKENSWTPEEHPDAVRKSVGVCRELADRGRFFDAAPLKGPATARHGTRQGGKKLVHDGPFVETKEHLGGYFLVEADNHEEAMDIAFRLPGTERGWAEVWPVMEVEGLPASS